jgi:LEA14-like dessication related protein
MRFNDQRSILRAAAAAGVGILLGACAITHLQAPTVTLVSAELADAQIQEQRFKVRLHVQNPNDRPLPIKSVDCTLQIEGVDVGQGKSIEPFTVPANGASDFEMLITTNFASSVPNLLLRVAQRGQLPEYRLYGSVIPDQRLLPPIPFSKSGQIAQP